MFGVDQSSPDEDISTGIVNHTAGKNNSLQLMICDLKDALGTIDNDMSISYRLNEVSFSGQQGIIQTLSWQLKGR